MAIVTTAAMATANRIGRLGIVACLLDVTVPVMFEWIVHTNAYEPAGNAGMS